MKPSGVKKKKQKETGRRRFSPPAPITSLDKLDFAVHDDGRPGIPVPEVVPDIPATTRTAGTRKVQQFAAPVLLRDLAHGRIEQAVDDFLIPLVSHFSSPFWVVS